MEVYRRFPYIYRTSKCSCFLYGEYYNRNQLIEKHIEVIVRDKISFVAGGFKIGMVKGRMVIWYPRYVLTCAREH